MTSVTNTAACSTHTRIDLTGVWRFIPDPENHGEALGFHRAGHDVRFWREAAVPDIVDNYFPEIKSYEGPMWFVRDFTLPQAGALRHWVLRFEAVYQRATVWVDGQRLGAFTGGFLPFEWPLDPTLATGVRHRLTVQVDNRRREGDVPGKLRGWRTQGGILREVYLESRPQVTTEILDLRAAANGDLALKFQVDSKAGSSDIAATLTVTDAAGNDCASFAATLNPACDPTCEISGRCAAVTPWSPETPALYTLRLNLYRAGQPIRDELRVTTGFRTLSIENRRLMLNGREIFIKGLNRHDDSPATGLAMDLATTEADLRAIKALGANFVRLAHYPHHPATLDLCDRLGLLALCEIPLYWWRGECAEAVIGAAKTQLDLLIKRDRHHPCVAFWCVSNETEENSETVREGNRELIRHARNLDPSRWAVHSSYLWSDFAEDDVLCLTYYPTLHGSVSEALYDCALSAEKWSSRLPELAARYPDKPLLVIEFGYMGWPGVREGMVAETLQCETLKHEYAGIMREPSICGVTIWCYADHPWPEEDFLNRVIRSPYGIVTRDRREKPAASVVRQLFEAPPPPPPAPQPADNRRVVMVRPHLRDIPEVPFPEGFSIRPMSLADTGLWEDIWIDAEPFSKIERGLFHREFAADPAAVPRRCFLVIAPNGCAVGTISAWYDRDFQGEDYGRIHWVATRPAWQGKGLAKAALAHALKVMSQWHDRAYLVTSSGRTAAIRLYEKFGFAILPPP